MVKDDGRSPTADTQWLRRAAVFGASGGIGAAIVRVLADRGVPVAAISRSGDVPRHHLVTPIGFDIEQPESIAAAAAVLAQDPPQLTVIATGVLTLPDGTGPEKSFKAIEPQAMTRVMAINALGPALVAQAMLQLMPRADRWVLAAISARVGSISDNRLGGWHSYRASKAALNMLVRNFAIEMARTHPQGCVLALHPGTVETPLSAPFRAGLKPGQLTRRREAAEKLVATMLAAGPAQSGQLLDREGGVIAP